MEGWNTTGDLGACGILQAIPCKERNYANLCTAIILTYICRQHFLGKAELVELKVALTFFMLMCYFDNYPCQHQKITYMPAPVFFLNIKNWVLGHL